MNSIEELIEEIDKEAIAKVTELVGEMVWGIDLPHCFTLTVQKDPFSEPETVAVPPKSMEPVFEAIYQKLKLRSDYTPYSDLKQKVLDFESQLQQLQGEGWIPVSERLPDHDSEVIVTFIDNDDEIDTWTAFYSDLHDIVGWYDRRCMPIKVTHWREIPSPPEEQ